jgi:hypothetical protein
MLAACTALAVFVLARLEAVAGSSFCGGFDLDDHGQASQCLSDDNSRNGALLLCMCMAARAIHSAAARFHLTFSWPTLLQLNGVPSPAEADSSLSAARVLQHLRAFQPMLDCHLHEQLLRPRQMLRPI